MKSETKTTIKIVVAFVIALLLTTAAAALYTSWHAQISWTYENTGFTVWKESACANAWPEIITLGVVTGTETYEFWLRNDGNVPIIISVVNEVAAVNATPTWAPINKSYSIAPTSVVSMNLTLAFTGNGSYDFRFNSTKVG